MNSKVQKYGFSYITFSGALAIIGVIIMHTNSFWNFEPNARWALANVVESICFFAVPIFFMISGATLIDYRDRYDTKTFFKKRLLKTFIPFIIWSLLGLLGRIYLVGDISLSEVTPKFIVHGILDTSFIDYYWFFLPLFCAYLAIPLFAAVRKDSRKSIFTYLVVIGSIINIVIPSLFNFADINFKFPLHLWVANDCLIYVLIGYLLSHYKISRKWRIAIYITAIVGLMLTIFGTYILSMQADKISTLFKGHLNFPAIMYSVGVFVLFQKLGDYIQQKKLPKLKRVFEVLAGYAYGIYLVHWFILMSIFVYIQPDRNSLLFQAITPIVVIIISTLVIFIIRKIPFVGKYILP